MQNIKNFEEFTNEGKFMDALKGIFNFFKGASKKFQDSMNQFTKKIEATKTWDQTYKETQVEMNKLNGLLNDEINNCQDVTHIRKSLYDYHRNLFTSLMVTSNKLTNQGVDGKQLLPVNFFKGTTFADMYNSQKTEDFVAKKLQGSIDGLVRDMGAKSGYSKDDIEKSIKEVPDLSQVKEEQTTDQTKQTTDQTKQNTEKPAESTTEKPAQQPKTENYTLKFNDFIKILEAAANTPAPTTPPAKPDANTAKPDANTKPDANKPAAPTNTAKPDMTKFKQQVINDTKNNFFGQIVNKKLNDFKATVSKTAPAAGTDNTKNVETIAKTMKGSSNIDTKKNILNFITNADKNTLKKVRDLGGGKDKLGAL